MKNLKIFAIALAVLAAGTFAFADAAAESYLSKFTNLVTVAESCAKNNEASKLSEITSQKTEIDALRKTVTLTTIQRFSDWRLTKRYDTACAKLKAVSQKDSASESVHKVGEAVGDAAEKVGGAVKEKASDAVKKTKESVEDAVSGVKDSAKKKVDDTVKGAKDAVDETVTGAAEKASEKIQKGTEGFLDKINKFFGGDKNEEKK